MKKPRYLTFLNMLIVILWAACLISQTRLVSFHGGYVCAAILPYPFVCILFDMIAEVYGFQESRKALWLGLLCIFIFVIILYFFSKLPTPLVFQNHAKTFNDTISPLFRIFSCNSIAFMVGQYINIYIFSKLQFLLRGRWFIIRSVFSTFLGDTLTFALSLVGDFSGLLSEHTIFVLVVDELLIMYAMAILLAFPGSIIVSFFKKTEPDFNMSVNFNPFK